MKKINVALCILAFLLTACDEFCGFTRRDPNTTYKWSYSNNGTTPSREFTTNEYGQASFEVPDDTDCNKVEVKKKDSPVMEEDAGSRARLVGAIREGYN
ncbi:MAG: hypothetical protein WAM70_17045 [Pyrinomonadaceae bacterium]